MELAFQQLESSAKGAPPDFPATIKLMVRDKADNDKSNFEQLAAAIKESKKGSNLGVIAKVLMVDLIRDAPLILIRGIFLGCQVSGRLHGLVARLLGQEERRREVG